MNQMLSINDRRNMRVNIQYQINFLELLKPSSRTLLSLLVSCFAFAAFLNQSSRTLLLRTSSNQKVSNKSLMINYRDACGRLEVKAVEEAEVAVGGAGVYFLGVGLQVGPEHVREPEDQLVDRLYTLGVFHMAEGVGKYHHSRL